MKLICTGDWHIRLQKPENRIDDYYNSQKEKVRWILNQRVGTEKTYINQPGDFFDNPSIPYSVFSDYVNLISANTRGDYSFILSVFGQHDLRYRASKHNTALNALNCTTNILILNENPIYVLPNTRIVGCSWGEEIPKPSPDYPVNILVIHKMIIDEKLYAQQDNFERADKFIKKHKFDLIVSGDNHKGFIQEYKGRYLVNCGSLMRTNKDQFDHKPFIVIYDTDEKTIERRYVPIRPINEVFNIDNIEKLQARNEKLEVFVKGLSEHKDMGLNFMDNLQKYIKQEGINKEIENLIMECADNG